MLYLALLSQSDFFCERIGEAMARLTIYRDNYVDSTVVSNRFIDEYMKDANDAQLKVYLYLIRMLNANLATSVSEMADIFNHTEKDIDRALKYWEKKDLLELDYDADKNLIGIHLRDLNTSGASAAQGNVALSAAPVQALYVPSIVTAGNAETTPAETNAEDTTAAPAFTKPTYSPDQLREFKSREQTAQLLFIAESYIGKPLSPSEMKSILFFTDVLHFSDDLIDYLLQYCVDLGKKNFKYIEAVAIAWAEKGITTPEEAQSQTPKYNKNFYTIWKALGKGDNTPTAQEADYICRWMNEYGFSMELILEACNKAVLAVNKNRINYVDGTLNNWLKDNVHSKADIHKLDDMYQKRRSSAKPSSSSSNKFNHFAQNSYDFDALEKELLSN